MGALYILLAIVGVAIEVMVALEIETAANEKGYEGKKYFWYALLFGPAGWAIVIALPDRKTRASLDAIGKLLEKTGDGQRDRAPGSAPAGPGAAKREAPVAAPAPEKVPERDTVPEQSEQAAPTGPQAPVRAAKAGMVICPACGQEQPEGRSVCWNCGVRFIDAEEG